jgi:Zn-dependent alcohol dehydrogenase
VDVRAAVAVAAGKPLEISTVQFDGPREGEVMVETASLRAGVVMAGPHFKETAPARERTGRFACHTTVAVTRYIRLLGI